MSQRWREIADRDVPAVIALWERCGLTRPWNDPVGDVGFARRSPSSTILLHEENGKIVASVMVGHDGHRGTLYYVGVDPAFQGQGLGREMVETAERWLSDQGVWKMNILVRGSNESAKAFWARLGYSANEVVSLGKSLKR